MAESSTKGVVMRWLWLLVTLLSWLLCFTRHGPGAMAFWLLVGIFGMIATTLAFAQARIEANAQPDLRIELMRHKPDGKSRRSRDVALQLWRFSHLNATLEWLMPSRRCRA